MLEEILSISFPCEVPVANENGVFLDIEVGDGLVLSRSGGVVNRLIWYWIGNDGVCINFIQLEQR